MWISNGFGNLNQLFGINGCVEIGSEHQDISLNLINRFPRPADFHSDAHHLRHIWLGHEMPSSSLLRLLCGLSHAEQITSWFRNDFRGRAAIGTCNTISTSVQIHYVAAFLSGAMFGQWNRNWFRYKSQMKLISGCSSVFRDKNIAEIRLTTVGNVAHTIYPVETYKYFTHPEINRWSRKQCDRTHVAMKWIRVLCVSDTTKSTVTMEND